MTASPRYFYDCPIKAALMAKYHGMWFSIQNGIRSNAKVGLPAIESHVAHGHLQLEGGRFYLHSDSLHLLEPQLGDRDEHGFLWDGAQWQCPFRLMRTTDALTIQRNGIPFMWPEHEAA